MKKELSCTKIHSDHRGDKKELSVPLPNFLCMSSWYTFLNFTFCILNKPYKKKAQMLFSPCSETVFKVQQKRDASCSKWIARTPCNTPLPKVFLYFTRKNTWGSPRQTFLKNKSHYYFQYSRTIWTSLSYTL